MFLIDDLLMLPVSGIKFVLNQIQKVVDRELNDESVIKEQLLELELRHEMEEISEEDYKEQEAELFARLRVIKARQMDLLDEINTAQSTSIVIETADEEWGYEEPSER
ncbi:MAG TPA: gas vesicle protein GvpG [Blastocatellia bacterium]|jgi:hypothetical protein